MHPHLHTKDNTGISPRLQHNWQIPHLELGARLTKHATACEEVMMALDECHARGFLWKSLGMCNSAKTQVNKCLRAQRLERTKLNREKAKAKNEEIRAKWAEIDANS